MPELPEVETIKKGLEQLLVGHTIEDVEILSQRVFYGEPKDIVGGKVKTIRRFAKVLSIDLSNNYSIVIHVKMTGQLIYRGPKLKQKVDLSKKVRGGIPGPFTRTIFHLDKNGKLFYNDQRNFGWIKVLKTPEVESLDFIKKLGPEPFKDLTLKRFKQIISKYKTAVKMVLMDQQKIGGVGNIYANEALFMARINPKRPANSLSEKEKEKLYDSVLKTLKLGLKYRGASENVFVTATGEEGEVQEHFLSYARKGETCSNCKKEKIQKIFLGGRGTFFCPACQK